MEGRYIGDSISEEVYTRVSKEGEVRGLIIMNERVEFKGDEFGRKRERRKGRTGCMVKKETYRVGRKRG